jgi:hypothetical protein
MLSSFMERDRTIVGRLIAWHEPPAEAQSNPRPPDHLRCGYPDGSETGSRHVDLRSFLRRPCTRLDLVAHEAQSPN